MNRLLLSLLVMASLVAITLAQDTPPVETQPMPMAPGMMDHHQGMMPMMQMMMLCPATMMSGGMMEGAVRWDRTAAKALARAFLAGRAPEANVAIEDVAIEDVAFAYIIAYRQNGVRKTLLVDATSGEVRPLPDQ